jgi:hypothetical protein
MLKRKIMLVTALALTLVFAATLLAACGSSDDSSSSSGSPSGDVASGLKGDDQISQYADAFAAAGISGGGPYTVFAASNDALTAAGVTLDGDAVKASVIDGSNLSKDELSKGTSTASLLDGNSVTTWSGIDGTLYVNSFKLVGDPITTGNGTIYVIDGVIQPK